MPNSPPLCRKHRRPVDESSDQPLSLATLESGETPYLGHEGLAVLVDLCMRTLLPLRSAWRMSLEWR